MAPTEFTLVSLNLRTIKDSWLKREGAVLDQIAAEEPHLVALQETSSWAMQARWIAWRLNRRSDDREYRSRHVRKRGWRGVLEGLAVLSDVPIVRHGSLDLGGNGRVAQRGWFEVAPGVVVDVVNVHLPNGDGQASLRLAQAERLLKWIAPSMQRRPVVVVGDFNSVPGSDPIRLLSSKLHSAHMVVHGAEPLRTAPAIPPGDDWPGHVIDYVFVNDRVKVQDCRVAFSEPSHRHPHLYPSDHLGLVTRLSVG